MFIRALDFSTAHCPSETPDFKKCRVAQHDHGWIVFVNGDLTPKEIKKIVPKWLRPIYIHAVATGAVLINFDSDGDVEKCFETWEW